MEIAAVQRRDELAFVEYFVGKFGDEFAQPVSAVGVAAARNGEVQPTGDFGGEIVFLFRGAAVGDFDSIGELEYRMLHGDFGLGGNGFVGVGIQVGASAMVLPQNATEGVRRNDESTHGVGGPAQFLRAVEATLVAIDTEAEDVAHVGIGLHRTDEDDVVQSGEGGELVTVPRAGVFSNTEPAQTEAFGFEDEVFGRQAGISAALGGMNVEVE